MGLKQIRTERNLSLAALGEMIGRDASTVQRAETMHKSAKLETFVQCADVLGVRLEDLFTDRTDLERLIVDAFRSLPPERQRGWADMARAILAEQRAP
jgi:transcriptional regulator with XRE-family HTH domain